MTPSERDAAADPVSAEPAILGPRGRAWTLPLPSALTVASLMIEAPWAHPFWHSYAFWLVHLRPAPGTPELIIHLPGATHELVLAALDPKHPRERVLAGGPLPVLTPMNFAAQIIEPTDAAALERVWRAAQAVCDGRLSPDTDHRHSWAALFGGNMLQA